MRDDGDARDVAELLALLPALHAWRARREADGKEVRPFVVEIAGMPKAGKSSTIGQVRHFFSHGPKTLRRNNPERAASLPAGYRVYTPAEGVSLRTPTLLRANLLEYNTWAGAYALQELLWANHNDFYDLVILDRGPWDAGCWLEYVRQTRADDPEVPDGMKDIIHFFQLPEWMVKADLHIVLVVDPKDASNREQQERLITHGGPASDSGLMEAMAHIYRSNFETLRAAKKKHCDQSSLDTALLLDTTGRERLDVARDVIERILRVAEDASKGTAEAPSLQESFQPPLTARLVKGMLSPFLKNMKPSQRRNANSLIEDVVSQTKLLGPAEREAFRANLEGLIPDEAELLNSVSTDVLADQLRDVLERSRAK